MRKDHEPSRSNCSPAIRSPGKRRITIMIDRDVIEAFRNRAGSSGRRYQTLMNEVLRAALADEASGAGKR